MKTRWLAASLAMFAYGSSANAEAQPEPYTNPYEQLQKARQTSVDVAITTGWNNPGGAFGLEGEYRMSEYLGLGGGAGMGGWGIRQKKRQPGPLWPAAFFFGGLASPLSLKRQPTAIASISMRAPFGSPDTATVERAGGADGK